MATTDLADPTNSLLCAVRATNKEFDHYTAAFGALKNGGNPNGCTADSNSALMWAAWSDLPPVVRLLIQHGADVLYKNKSGQTALLVIVVVVSLLFLLHAFFFFCIIIVLVSVGTVVILCPVHSRGKG